MPPIPPFPSVHQGVSPVLCSWFQAARCLRKALTHGSVMGPVYAGGGGPPPCPCSLILHGMFAHNYCPLHQMTCYKIEGWNFYLCFEGFEM